MVRVDLCVTVDCIIRVRLGFSIRVRVRVQIRKYLSPRLIFLLLGS